MAKQIHIALDFDKVLAQYDGKDIFHTGEPIKPMVDKLKKWLEKGYKVSIFTARVAPSGADGVRTDKFIKNQYKIITEFLLANGLPELEITAVKFGKFSHFVDDKAVPIISGEGKYASHITVD